MGIDGPQEVTKRLGFEYCRPMLRLGSYQCAAKVNGHAAHER